MQTQKEISFLTLLLMISFASVNAVLFTPALPNIVIFFDIAERTAELTITIFLIAYAFGQLIYGPLANRFGRKPALYTGIGMQLFGSLLCVLSGVIHEYWLLVAGRLLLGLGAGAGFKLAFTLVHECYTPKIASKKLSYLTLSFAITPGLAMTLGGILTAHYGWISCFYAGAIYGLILLIFSFGLPETKTSVDIHALKFRQMFVEYSKQLKNTTLVMGGMLMGTGTSVVYVFAALAPFLAINIFGMKSAEYGLANILPSIGMALGGILSAKSAENIPLQRTIQKGILVMCIGAICMCITMLLHLPVIFSLFLPATLIYFGISFIIANASSIAMSRTIDKAHGAAVMSFINLGLATLTVLCLGFFHVRTILLPATYIVIGVGMLWVYNLLVSHKKQDE